MTTRQPTTPFSPVVDGPLAKPLLYVERAEPALALDAEVYRAILDRVEDGVYLVDREKRVRLWNRGAEAITGYSRKEVIGERCNNNQLCHVDESGRLLCTNGCPIQRALDTGVPVEANAFLRHRLGHRIPVAIETSPVVDRENRLVGAVEVFRRANADHRHDQIIEELSRLAMVDDLTRLPNRRHFDQQIERRLAELERFGWPFGLLMIDIDHFKRVNDDHGHLVGDEILQLVARTLSANCRIFDTVARWGGEEFGALIANVGEDDLCRVAEKLRAMVEASSLPGPSGEFLQVTVSIGGAAARPHETVADLMKRTDDMLYAAKKGGRNRVCV